MLLLNVFEGGPVPLKVFDGAVRVLLEKREHAGLDENPFGYALCIDDFAGVLADPYQIMRPLVEWFKVCTRGRLANAGQARGVFLRLPHDIRCRRFQG